MAELVDNSIFFWFIFSILCLNLIIKGANMLLLFRGISLSELLVEILIKFDDNNCSTCLKLKKINNVMF